MCRQTIANTTGGEPKRVPHKTLVHVHVGENRCDCVCVCMYVATHRPRAH